MYQVTCDGLILHDHRSPTLQLINPTWTDEINKTGELTFSIAPTHPYYANILIMESDIRVYKDDVLVFKGRPYNIETMFNKVLNVSCEGCLAYLLDSLIRPFEFTGSVEDFFTQIITEHNAQVATEQQFTLGTISVVDAAITRSSINHISAWEAINTRLLATHGGYLVLTYDEGGAATIDYLDDYADTSTQVIEFGENIADILLTSSAAETYTAVVPLGAKLSEIDETSESDTRLTIASENDGNDYLINGTLAAIYGVIYAPTELTTWPDVTLASNLKTKGLAFLNNTAITLKNTINLSAVDLSYITAGVESYKVGDYIQVISEPHDIDATYLLKSMSVPLNNPANTGIVIGETKASYVGETVNNQRDVVRTVQTINADYTTNAQVAAIANEAIENNTSILQSAEQIILEALQTYTKTQDFNELSETIETQLTVMAGQMDFNFNTVTSQINTLSGDTTQSFDNITKYIRFIDGDIVLGQSDSQIKLRLENDILYFFSGADSAADVNTAFAYFSANKLYVTDGEFINSLGLGNFAFLPRANGNLSFKKVRG